MTTATGTFTVIAALPCTFGNKDCCPQYEAEIDTGHQQGELHITYTHNVECDVWKYIP